MVWLLYAVFGLIMRSMAPVVTPILADLHMTYAEMGLTLGSWQLVYIPVSIVAGIAMDRWGIRRTLFAGALLLSLSEGLRYLATGFVDLLPMVALFGVGGPLISIGAPKSVFLWFTGRDRATAVGVYTTAPWIGGFFALAATNSLVMPLTGNSWRLTFLSYSIVGLACGIIWLLLARDNPGQTTYERPRISEAFVKLLRIPNIRLVLAGGMATLFIDHGFSNWLPKILENNGFSSDVAGYMASIPLLVALPAVLLLPRFIPPRMRGRVLAGMALMTGIVLLVAQTRSPAVLVLSLVLYGVTLPAFLPMLMLMIMDEPGVDSGTMGMIGGLFFAVAEIGGFTGPLLMGVMVDATGTFLAGAGLIAGAGVLMCLVMLRWRESRAE